MGWSGSAVETVGVHLGVILFGLCCRFARMGTWAGGATMVSREDRGLLLRARETNFC